MARGRIGILAHDQDPHIRKRRGEGAQDVRPCGQPWATRRGLGTKKLTERGQGVSMSIEHGNPAGVNEFLERLGAEGLLALAACA